MADLLGGCLCGAIRYRIAGPLGPANYCHCSDCRRVTGGAFNIGVRVDARSLVVSGEAAWYAHPGGSGQSVRRAFCPRCGSPLFTTHPARLDSVWVRAGTLDDPTQVKPEYEAWADSKVEWAHPPPQLKAYARNRPA